jgi:hypothetical protein
MLLFFVLLALASILAFGILLVSLAVGAWLLLTGRSRTVGLFVLITPTLSALSAVLTSWGAMFLCDSLSHSAGSLDAWQRWQILAFWAGPLGFGFGGFAGASIGALISAMLIRRTPSDNRSANSPEPVSQP